MTPEVCCKDYACGEQYPYGILIIFRKDNHRGALPAPEEESAQYTLGFSRAAPSCSIPDMAAGIFAKAAADQRQADALHLVHDILPDILI